MRIYTWKNYSRLFFCAFLGLALASCGGGKDEHDGHEEEEEHGHGHEHEGAVELKEGQAKQFGVEWMKIEPGSFAEVVRVSGRVEPAATDRMTVTARRSGIITLSSGITVGSQVGAGTLIGTISSRGVQGGDASAAAHAAVEASKRELDRLTPLYKDGIVTAGAYNEALRAYREAVALAGSSPAGSGSETAPCAGTVTDLFVQSGQYVEVGAQIAIVSRNTRLTLRADVPEKYYSLIPAIVTANFRPDHSDEVLSLSSLGGRRISGDASASARNGYIPLYFSFDSRGKVAPGAYAEIYLIAGERHGVLSVPREAIIEMQGKKYVYVVEHGHAFEKRLVETGASDGNRVELLDGIKPGEEVVVKGASVVRMAETSAVAPPGHSHNH